MNNNLILNYNHPSFFADDGYDDYDYNACGSRRRFGDDDRSDSDYYGAWGDYLPNANG